jgi:putative hydrolase of the HAD superfamily
VSSPVRAVLFDAGHTLLVADYEGLAAQIRARGHAVSDSAVTAAERRARARVDAEQATQPTRERTGAGRYLRYLLGDLGVTGEEDFAAVAAWRRAFNVPVGLCHRADPDAAQALSRLRAAGVVSGVISNSNGSVRQALDTAGLLPHVSFVIDSTIVGVAKPDPRVFHLGLAAAQVAAREAVYVGDSYFVDVRGARAVGMSAVLFDPGGVCGARDCPIATTLTEAATLALEGTAHRSVAR